MLPKTHFPASGTPAHRASAVSIAALLLTLAGCHADDIFYSSPGKGKGALLLGWSIGHSVASGAVAAADRVHVLVARSSGTLYDDTIAFPVGESEVRVRIEVQLEQSAEVLVVAAELLDGTRVVARGGQSVTLQQGTTTVAPIVVDDIANDLAMGDQHACYIGAAGVTYCWGGNEFGQLGIGSNIGSSRPVAVAGAQHFVAVAAGVGHTCALAADGSAYCWGNGLAGQLGDGKVTTSTVPVPVSGGLHFVDISAGVNHSCGLTVSGEIWCWGDNAVGQLAASPTRAAVPAQSASTLHFSAVRAGWLQTCGIVNNAGYCWGQDYSGGSTPRNTPTVVPGGLNLRLVLPGIFTACALNANGAAYCWGGSTNTNFGQLGNSGYSYSATPVAVSGSQSFTTLSVSNANSFYAGHVCGINPASLAWCWGLNRFGELGTNTQGCLLNTVAGQQVHRCSNVPVPVQGGHRYTTIAVGNENTCGISDSGTVYCWGWGLTGMLGQGDLGDQALPVPLGAPIAPPTIKSLILSGRKNTLAVGDTLTLVAAAVDAQGIQLPMPMVWSTSDSTRVAIQSNRVPSTTAPAGLIVARNRGNATITAALQGLTATFSIVVN